MIDVNAEAEKTLSALDCTVAYYYPDDFKSLPIVTYFNLTETPDFSSDNEEDIQSGTVVVDIWCKTPTQCGEIGIKVNDIMTADGWSREFSRDLPPDDSKVYHRTMRFVKDFYLKQEE